MEKVFRTSSVENELLLEDIAELRERVTRLERKMIHQEAVESQKSLNFWLNMMIGSTLGLAVIIIADLILQIIGVY